MFKPEGTSLSEVSFETYLWCQAPQLFICSTIDQVLLQSHQCPDVVLEQC